MILLGLVSLGALAVLASLRLLDPLGGDGALFVVAGEILHGGGSLYTDFWDVKQPGIFYFFQAAGSLFGFNFIGVQLFQMAYWAAICALVIWLLRPHLHNPWISLVGPLVLLGPYYAFASVGFLAQIEILVSGPLIISALLLAGAEAHFASRRRTVLVLAGASAAIVVIFKLALAPILAGFLTASAVEAYRKKRPAPARKHVLSTLAWFCLGAGLVVLAEIGHLMLQGSLYQAFEAAFIIGPEWALYAQEAPGSRLLFGGLGYLAAFFSWFGFLFLGVLSAAYSRNKSNLAIYMLIWIVLGLACILIQRFSWWYYHWQLLYFPTAILAVLGLDAALDWLCRHIRLTTPGKVALVAMAVLPACGGFALATQDRIRLLLEHRTEILTGNFDNLRAEIAPSFRDALSVASGIDGLSPQASVYVMGDPGIYIVLGKSQAVSVNGWGVEFFSPRNWERLDRELHASLPDALFLASYYENAVRRSPSSIQTLLETRYVVGSSSSDGTWYLLKDKGA